MAEIYGIDVSKHNGVIDWRKVKASGKGFAFIRLGWCGYDGKIVANGGLDPMFKTNAEGAIAAGLDIGVYLYSYAKTAAAATVSAQETLALVKPYKLTYPIAFDIEDAMHVSMTKEQNTAIVNAFLSTIETAKYYGMLYTYKSFAESNLNMSQLKGFDFWVAQYASKCTYAGPYGIWQYNGDVPGFTGKCDGVNGACDLNVSYKDYAAIIKNAKLNTLTSNPVQVDPSIAKIAALEAKNKELEATMDAVRTFVDDFYIKTIAKLK